MEERLSEDKNADLNDIDVSNIKDMRHYPGLFYNLDPHNIKIDQWDVSNVKDMFWMFYGCENFNCDLSKWDVSNVEDMRAMFYGCWKFLGDGLENWKPIKCKDMKWAFVRCDSLKNIPSWYHE